MIRGHKNAKASWNGNHIFTELFTLYVFIGWRQGTIAQADVKSSYFMFPGDQFFFLKVSDLFAAIVEISRYGSF